MCLFLPLLNKAYNISESKGPPASSSQARSILNRNNPELCAQCSREWCTFPFAFRTISPRACAHPMQKNTVAPVTVVVVVANYRSSSSPLLVSRPRNSAAAIGSSHRAAGVIPSACYSCCASSSSSALVRPPRLCILLWYY